MNLMARWWLTAVSCVCPLMVAAQTAAPPKLEMTRAFAGSCLFASAQTKHAAPLLAAILPSLLSVSLDRLGAAFSTAGEAKTISKTAGINTELSARSAPDCVQLVTGSFYAGTAEVSSDVLPASTPSIVVVADEMTKRGILLADRPSFFYEGRLKFSADGSAVAIETTALIYRQRYDGSLLGKFSSTRDLVVSAAISEPASDGNKGTATVASVAFEKLSPGEGLYLFPAPSPPSMLWLPYKEPENAAPRVLQLTISETRDANQFLSFVGDVLKGSKDQLLAQGEELLIPAKRKEAELKQQQAEQASAKLALDNLAAAKAAEVAARDALDDFRALKVASPADVRGQRTAAGKAVPLVLNANGTAAVASLPAPFSSVDLLELDSAIKRQSP
jgi:hypothetical protein